MPLTAVFVLVAGDVATVFAVPLTALLVVPEPLGADAVLGLLAAPLAVVVPPCDAVPVVPLAAVPEPLTVAAFTVVEPEALTSPEPLLLAVTDVEPTASVTALVGAVFVAMLAVEPSSEPLVPLLAVPEPLTVAALTVVDPAALTSPEPLFVALTVVEPDALVKAV